MMRERGDYGRSRTYTDGLTTYVGAEGDVAATVRSLAIMRIGRIAVAMGDFKEAMGRLFVPAVQEATRAATAFFAAYRGSIE